MHGEICTDELNVSEEDSSKIEMRTCSITQKYWIAHNFFNFHHNNRHVAPHFDHINERDPTEEEFFKFELSSSHNYSK